ncbi:NAD(P)-dependent dehydrogenase (short-subunit alcohol dehydrogenase family) [Nocardioides sp. J9]|uniref:SDR family NAD(P)-dependent oxidoreductase n=1 Tax=Nocardioides sp. J9 TaxID=935844 RepID=UPI0011A1193D|nr:SDR family oxidoreductase [Nocardioides sp. J9]TWG94930.1 NAD(P)-dependent dehydrogenase (short-subunit alcohol dehydrogenase family) [Nocardioides sp. J9]
MDLGLKDARVLVTGGASNIGRGIVHAFAGEGSRIVLSDIDQEQAEKVGQEALDRGAAAVELVVGDLVQEGEAQRAADRAVEQWDGIDVLVNNAGWSVPGFIARNTDRANWQKTVEVNFFTAIAATQAVLPAMREQSRGSIVFIASESAFGQIRQGVYGATKAAVVALARTTAREHGRHGIRSNIVCPGLVVPEGPEAVGSKSLWAVGKDNVFNDDQAQYLLKDTPLGRLTTAEDVAASVLFLASERMSRQVTGQLFSVSGGYTMP